MTALQTIREIRPFCGDFYGKAMQAILFDFGRNALGCTFSPITLAWNEAMAKAKMPPDSFSEAKIKSVRIWG
jgi:hypothetical protein